MPAYSCKRAGKFARASALVRVCLRVFLQVCSCEIVRVCSCKCDRTSVLAQVWFARASVFVRVCSFLCAPAGVRVQVGGRCLPSPNSHFQGPPQDLGKTQRLQPTVRGVKPISQARAIDQVAMRSELRQLDAKLSRRGRPFFFSGCGSPEEIPRSFPGGMATSGNVHSLHVLKGSVICSSRRRTNSGQEQAWITACLQA